CRENVSANHYFCINPNRALKDSKMSNLNNVFFWNNLIIVHGFTSQRFIDNEKKTSFPGIFPSFGHQILVAPCTLTLLMNGPSFKKQRCLNRWCTAPL